MASALEVVQKMLDALKRKDGPAVLECMHPDVVVVEPASLAYGGTHRGLAAFQKDVFGAIMGNLSADIGRCELIGSGNKVAASMDITFTSLKSGNSVDLRYVEIYTVSDGRIIHLDVYPQDTVQMVAFWNANV